MNNKSIKEVHLKLIETQKELQNSNEELMDSHENLNEKYESQNFYSKNRDLIITIFQFLLFFLYLLNHYFHNKKNIITINFYLFISILYLGTVFVELTHYLYSLHIYSDRLKKNLFVILCIIYFFILALLLIFLKK